MNPVALTQNAMIVYFAPDVRRINHFLKVYGYAKAIGELEGLEAQTQLTLEISALCHDIGIKLSEHKYGSASGFYQQLEGPAEARALLTPLPIAAEVIDRVCWLIAHHHTYLDIQGFDYQILVEADFLVNIDEDHLARESIDEIHQRIFRTHAGTAFLRALYPQSTQA